MHLMDFLALAGNLKRRASVILDSTETKAKEDEQFCNTSILE